MASSGWQGQRNVQTKKYPHMALNLRIDSINHTGTTLKYTGIVRVICTSGHISWNPASVSLTGGGSKNVNLNLSTGGHADTGSFSCTVNNVPTSATSYTVKASLNAGSVASGSASWTLSFGSGGNPPSDVSVVLNGSTWNSIDATVSVGSWGGTGKGNIQLILATGTNNGDAEDASLSTLSTTPRYAFGNPTAQSSAMSQEFSVVQSDAQFVYPTPLDMKGMLCYMLFGRGANSVSPVNAEGPVAYLPPAPSQFSYTDPGGAGTKTFPVTFSGVAANNHTTYDTDELNRTIRYKIDNGSWTYVDNATVAAIDFVSSFNVAVPAGSVATVEGWQTYHGEQSEVSTITLANTNQACVLYGSVSGQAKELTKVYASVNGQAKKLVKIYASVGGVAKKVYEDV